MTLDNIKKLYKNSKKSYIIVYLSLKILVIFCLVREIMLSNYHNAFFCLISLVLFALPLFIKDKFKITLPNGLEIMILLFIFSSEILGETRNFYSSVIYFDKLLHIVNGFLAASVGFSLINLLNSRVKDLNMSALFVAIFAFCFSMTIGILWEFYEYSVDTFINEDMQKDTIVRKINSVSLESSGEVVNVSNIDHTILYDKKGNEIMVINNGYLDIGIIDTMADLFVNLLGALIFSIFGFLYITNNDKYHFADKFRITMK